MEGTQWKGPCGDSLCTCRAALGRINTWPVLYVCTVDLVSMYVLNTPCWRSVCLWPCCPELAATVAQRPWRRAHNAAHAALGGRGAAIALGPDRILFVTWFSDVFGHPFFLVHTLSGWRESGGICVGPFASVRSGRDRKSGRGGLEVPGLVAWSHEAREVGVPEAPWVPVQCHCCLVLNSFPLIFFKHLLEFSNYSES